MTATHKKGLFCPEIDYKIFKPKLKLDDFLSEILLRIILRKFDFDFRCGTGLLHPVASEAKKC